MLEARLGQSWETLMRRELFGPLGLASAGFGSPGRAGAIEQPFGHRRGPDGFETVDRAGGLYDIPAVVGPAGGVHISIPDLLKYLAAHCDRGALLTGQSWATLHTPPPGEATPWAGTWGPTGC